MHMYIYIYIYIYTSSTLGPPTQVRHLRETRTGFDSLLAAADGKQKLVYTFQLEFNAIDLELRVRDDTKVLAT